MQYLSIINTMISYDNYLKLKNNLMIYIRNVINLPTRDNNNR